LSQNPLHRGLADAQIVRQLAARPVCTAGGRFLLRPPDDSRLDARRCTPRFAPPMPTLKARDAFLFKPRLPLRYGRRARAQFALDLAIAHSVGQGENQPRPEYITSRQSSRLRPAFQLISLLTIDMQQSLIISHVIQTFLRCCRYHWDSPLARQPRLPVRRRKTLPRAQWLAINLLLGEQAPSCFGQVTRHRDHSLPVILAPFDPLIQPHHVASRQSALVDHDQVTRLYESPRPR